MAKSASSRERCALGSSRVELGEREQVLARQPRVVLDEGLAALDAEACEQVPQLATRKADRAARCSR